MSAPRRGELWWAALPVPQGSEPGYARPVVVVQSNRFNESNIGTVVVAAITSNPRLGEAPGNVRVGPSDTGLPRASVINVSQLSSLGRVSLTTRVGTLPAAAMNQVAEGLRLVLGL